MATINWKSGSVSAGGTDLHVTRGGEGPPIVILHRDIGTLDRLGFYDELAQSHEVIVPNHPGYGASPRPDWVSSVRDIAVIHRCLLDQLGLSKASLVGLGFGGWIAAEMATFAPSDAHRLVLVGPMGVKPPNGEILDQALISYIEYVKEGFHDPGAFERNYGATVTTAQLVQWDLCREMSFRVAWKPYMYNDSLPWLLRGVRSKALIVRGESDRIVPASAVALYAERLPNARTEIIAGAGHLIEMEQPAALARLIASFIASN
jgi:pimeloyl-ACP methyl ester carboxylesterase